MTLPSAVLDLTSWKLTLPSGAPGKPTEIKQPELATYSNTDYCCVPLAGGVRFRAPVNGVSTPKSKNCRSELREMKADGKTLASWSSTDGLGHGLIQDMAFTRLPTGNVGVGVVGGQVHDADDDIAVWRCEASGLWLAIGDHRVDWKLIDPHYRVGTRIQTALVVAVGRVTAYYQGNVVHTFDANISGCYFRAGAYTQANAGAKPVDSSNYGECTYFGLKVVHGPEVVITPSVPPVIPPVSVPPIDPTPVPAPSGDVVMIIRHGEKPPSKSDHTLNAAGFERARRLVGFFTHPKPGILTPTAIWASKGLSASMRPLQTVQPLAAALGLPINTRYDFEVAEPTVGKALTALHGVTLASAEHTAIPGVSKQFKLAKNSPKVPKAWPSSRFDLVWTFTRQPDNTWLFAQVPEALMSKDQGYGVSKAAGLLARVKQTFGIGN